MGGLSTNTVRWIIIGSSVVWVLLSLAVSFYGAGRGHPFLPLLICSLLPFPGWPLVLLAAAVAPRQPRSRRRDYAAEFPAEDTTATQQFPRVAPPRRR